MTDFDAIVVGAGAVGLACAAEIGKSRAAVLVLEADTMAGTGTSARNSEVVHAGFYYPTGSLKHLLCVRGRRLLYRYLDAARIPYRKCGKLVVATSDAELAEIEGLAHRAEANEVEGVTLISQTAVRRLEAEVKTSGALLSTETGVFDSHGYMTALIAQIEAQGGVVAYRSAVERVELQDNLFKVCTADPEGTSVTAPVLINSAGLYATEIARRIEGLPEGLVPALHLAKGSYFGLVGRSPFKRLVYPAPVDGGLGVHATIDLAGRVRFGPDVEWLSPGLPPGEVDYRVNPARAEAFYAAVRRYFPALQDGALTADYAGCRPKLTGPGNGGTADFVIQTVDSHGLAGLVNLFGIESPGLTASLAIAERVAQAIASVWE